MKTRKTGNFPHKIVTTKYTVRYGVTALAIAALAACGGGGGSGSSSNPAASNAQPAANVQIVSFGDELSDVGTYAPVITASFGGGRFTTNPGEVWTQKVAEYFGSTLGPAYLGGFGQPLVASTGLGYAQGGARVQDPAGEGHASSSSPNADYAQATTVPVTQQVQNYLAGHGTFGSNQIVLMNGGTNDILLLEPSIESLVATDVAGGMDLSTAVQKEATAALVPVAQKFAATVQQIAAAGAGHIVVVNVADLGQTPLGLKVGASGQQLLTALAAVYNQAVNQTIQSLGLPAGKVVPVDLFGWQDGIAAAYQSNGFSVASTGTGCNIAQMVQNATNAGASNPQSFGSSLFCAPALYTVAGADQSYMFADLTNPSTHLHALFAQYVERQLASAGVSR